MRITITTKGSIDSKRSGMTVVEWLVATFIASIILTAIGSFTIYATRSFVALGNYSDLGRAGRNALDIMSREIRQTRCVVTYKTNLLVFEDKDGLTNLIYSWDSANRVLTREKAGVTSVLLTNCDYLSFSIFQRNPSNAFTFYPATNTITGQFDPTMCKLISLTWSCSREIRQQKVNTENVQTAKIVLRN